MAHFKIVEQSPTKVSWTLYDDQNRIAGVSAHPFPSRIAAVAIIKIIAANYFGLNTTYSKSKKGHSWRLSTLQDEAAGSAEYYPTREACVEAGDEFVRLARVATIEGEDAPRAVFLARVADEARPLEIAFEAEVGSADERQEWEFGDGDEGQGATVLHAYKSAGEYVVRLTVTGGSGLQASRHEVVKVQEAAPPPSDDEDIAPPLPRSGITRFHDQVSFLHQGGRARQKGLAADALKPHSVAVVRGVVLGRIDTHKCVAPLQGVRVTVKGRPELGETLTDAKGIYDIVVNGGAVLTLQFAQEGYFPLRRRVSVSWQAFSHVPEVVLTARGQVARVALEGEKRVAEGAAVKDQHGARQARLVFPQSVVDEGPREIGIVEFTVGEHGLAAMPAALPPSTAYTYAVDLSVAGQEGAAFETPVYHYVENFLKFPVGTPVPSGYFDEDKDCWTPAENGRVIAVVGIKAGKAAVDVDGKGKAAGRARLEELGFTDEELADIAAHYKAGQSLWRVPLAHFSAWDFNWPYGPPSDATSPNQPAPGDGDADMGPREPDCECHSLVSVQNQVLTEHIGLSGTPYFLVYSSERVMDRKTGMTLRIPLSGAAPPKSLKAIELEINIAGQEHAHSFAPRPNLQHSFTWDGKDAYGRLLQGRHPVKVRVGYTYGAVYQSPAEHEKSFAQYSGVPVTQDAARQDVTIWQEWTSTMGAWDARGLGFGGWSLSMHHVFDPVGRVIYLGDGGKQNCAGGLGEASLQLLASESEGVSKVELLTPGGVAVDREGNVFVADKSAARIHKLFPDGRAQFYAGNAFSEDEPPLFDVLMKNPSGATVGPDGYLYVADTGSHRVIRIGPDGSVARVAGRDIEDDSELEFSGDGGPAVKADLYRPAGVAVTRDGVVYIADTGNRRIRRVGVDGIITTVAGNGEDGSEGDGGPAIAASLEDPQDVAIGTDGALYIADDRAKLVRRVGVDGVITTFAGTRDGSRSALDALATGGKATHTAIMGAAGIEAGLDGSIYFSSWMDETAVVHRVDASGNMTTLAGSGGKQPGAAQPATSVRLAWPNRLAMGADGALHLADDGKKEGSVYRIRPPFEDQAVGEFMLPSADGTQLFHFDANGRHFTTHDTFTGLLLYRFDYDGKGFLSAVRDDKGLLLSVERGKDGVAQAIVSAEGKRDALAMEKGYLSAFTAADGKTVHRFAYVGEGLLAEAKWADGGVSRYGYDASGRLIHDENAESKLDILRIESPGHFQIKAVTMLPKLYRETAYSVVHAPNGNVTYRTQCCDSEEITELGADGVTRQRLANGMVRVSTTQADPRFPVYVALPRTEEVTTPSGLTAKTALKRALAEGSKADGLAVSFTDTRTVNDRVYTTTVDADQRRIVAKTPEGRASEMTMNADFRPISVKESGRGPLAYTWHADGWLESVTYGEAAPRRYAFRHDDKARTTEMTDPLGQRTLYEQDAEGRPRRVRRADGGEITFAFDVPGRAIGVMPPGRKAHRLTFNEAGLFSGHISAMGRSGMRLDYDDLKQLRSVVRQEAVTFDYDDAGRLVGIKAPRHEVKISLDTAARRVGALATEDITLSYQRDGSLVTGVVTEGVVKGEVGYAYNSDFRVETLTICGEEFGFSYDGDGLLTSIGELTIERDKAGRIAKLSVRGVSLTLTYDEHGGLIRQSARTTDGPLFDMSFERDLLVRIVRYHETFERKSRDLAYGYDAVGRLVLENRAGVETRHAYDANGNRLSGGAEYDGDDRLLRLGDYGFDYAEDGTLTGKTNAKTKEQWTYRFNACGFLESAATPKGEISYRVDGLGRRVLRLKDGKAAGGFIYGQGPQPLAQLDAKGKAAARFIYGRDGHVPDLMYKGDALFVFIKDAVGSVRLVVDATTGEVAQALDYDAFGRVLSDSNPGFQPFGFAGGLYDTETGLTRFGAREYDAEAGRWTAPDPMLFAGGDSNLYAYCGNDPVNAIDPSGLAPILSCPVVDPCRDWKTLPEIDSWEDALHWYFHGHGQPAKLSRRMLDHLRQTWQNGEWTYASRKSSSGFGRGWESGDANAGLKSPEGHWVSLTIGSFRYEIDSYTTPYGLRRVIRYSDTYRFPFVLPSGDPKGPDFKLKMTHNSILGVLLGTEPVSIAPPLLLLLSLGSVEPMEYQIFGCDEF